MCLYLNEASADRRHMVPGPKALVTELGVRVDAQLQAVHVENNSLLNRIIFTSAAQTI